jgi:hypothetical protein
MTEAATRLPNLAPSAVVERHHRRAPLLRRHPGAATFVALSAALLALFLGVRDLPMVDLPQHASQLSIWADFEFPFEGDAHFAPNFRTPYLLTYLLALSLTPLFGVLTSLKLVVWASIVGYATALALLARRLGHDPWLGLLGFPTALGHAFYFGFVSFSFATVIVLFCLIAALNHGQRPSLRRGATLALLSCLLLAAHGMAFAIGMVMVGLVLLRGGGTLLQRLAPLAAPFLLLCAWILPSGTTDRLGPDDWSLSPTQILDLPASLVGMYGDDPLATLGGLVILGLVLANVRLVPCSALRVVPLVFVVGGYALLPPGLLGLAWLNARFTGFIIPALLIAFLPKQYESPKSRALAQRTHAAVTTVWLAWFGVRLIDFNREARAFYELIDRLPPGLAMRPVIFDRTSRAFPGVPVYLHYSAYYQAQKGGRQGFTFAVYPSSAIRFCGAHPPLMAGGAEWNPKSFDASREAPLYDYFLVRSEIDRSAQLFATATVPVELDVHVGEWWGYRRGRD